MRGRTWLTGALAPLLLFLGVFSVYLPTAERTGVNNDAYAASAGSWRIATAGTLWFDDLDVKKINGTHKGGGFNRNGQWISAAQNGHVTVQRMPGPILAGIPAYWLFGGSGTSEADFKLWPAALAASSVTALAAVLLFQAMTTQVRVALALTGALTFAFATPTWTVSANGLWTHPITQLGIAGAAFAASRGRWWLAGAFLGIGMLGRPHVALIAACLGVGLAWSRRDWRIAVRVGLPALAALGLVISWNRFVFGNWSVTGGYDYATQRAFGTVGGGDLSSDQLLNYLGFFFSLGRGFLVWTPIVLVLLPALLRARRTFPDWAIWLAAGGLIYTAFQLRVNHFSGGAYFYGYRHGLELLTSIYPLLILSAPFLRPFGRQVAPLFIALQFSAMALGAAVEGFFASPDSVWTENGFWFALQHNPTTIGPFAVTVLAIGAWIGVHAKTVPAGKPPSRPQPSDLLVQEE